MILLHPAARRFDTSVPITADDVAVLLDEAQTSAAGDDAQGASVPVWDGLGLRLSGREKAGLAGSMDLSVPIGAGPRSCSACAANGTRLARANTEALLVFVV